MSEGNKRTLNAKGFDVPHRKGEVQVSVRMSVELHNLVKAIAIENSRSISQQCALWVRRAVKADDGQ